MAQDPGASVTDRFISIYFNRRYSINKSLGVASGPALGVLRKRRVRIGRWGRIRIKIRIEIRL